jgi:hypothetical protein
MGKDPALPVSSPPQRFEASPFHQEKNYTLSSTSRGGGLRLRNLAFESSMCNIVKQLLNSHVLKAAHVVKGSQHLNKAGGHRAASSKIFQSQPPSTVSAAEPPEMKFPGMSNSRMSSLILPRID